MRTYMDYNASVPLCAEAKEAILFACGLKGNASSVHTDGREVRRLIDEARESVAHLIGAQPGEVVFVSGGTEANNMALRGEDCSPGRRHLCMSAIEHVSVLEGHGFDPRAVELISVDQQGVIKPDHIDSLLESVDGVAAGVLFSVMLANNETGVIQPVADLGLRLKTHGGLLHSDAIQALGKIPVNVDVLGVDFMSLSAHKIGGPQGVGALFIRDGIARESWIRGGRQENSLRAGTENFPGIMGFGAAARAMAAKLDSTPAVASLRDEMEREIERIAPGVTFFSAQAERLPNTSCFGWENVIAETLVLALDLEGISVSSGSACSSGIVRKSHVLHHMGFSSRFPGGAVRVSLGYDSVYADVDRFLSAFARIAVRMGFGNSRMD